MCIRDSVLLDVPCSGLGVLKRNPDAKWRDTAERLPVLMELQKHILSSYSRMVKVGGIVVYATCSILPCENRGQVDAFLAENPNFRLLEMKRSVQPILVLMVFISQSLNAFKNKPQYIRLIS